MVTPQLGLGMGNGSFGAATSYATEAGFTSAATLGDLNGDGILDLVSAGYPTFQGIPATPPSGSETAMGPLAQQFPTRQKGQLRDPFCWAT